MVTVHIFPPNQTIVMENSRYSGKVQHPGELVYTISGKWVPLLVDKYQWLRHSPHYKCCTVVW